MFLLFSIGPDIEREVREKNRARPRENGEKERERKRGTEWKTRARAGGERERAWRNYQHGERTGKQTEMETWSIRSLLAVRTKRFVIVTDRSPRASPRVLESTLILFRLATIHS